MKIKTAIQNGSRPEFKRQWDKKDPAFSDTTDFNLGADGVWFRTLLTQLIISKDSQSPGGTQIINTDEDHKLDPSALAIELLLIGK